MMQTIATQQDHHQGEDEDRYETLAHELQRNFNSNTCRDDRLFTTDAEGLFDAYLAALPVDRRQHYTCRACRNFVERFGGIVTIGADGAHASPIWEPAGAPPLFKASLTLLDRMVRQARVTGVFLSSESVWGTVKNLSSKGIEWSHMHVVPEPSIVFDGGTSNAEQAMAERRQEYGMLQRGLADFSLEVVREAHRLLTVGGLYRSEKCIGVANWLLDLHESLAATKHTRARENIVWHAVASAPIGFAHVRSTMIGTLLEDIAAGKSFEDIKRAFGAKMDPLHYRRPQAAPTDGQLAAAESLVAKLGAEGSLERRYARLEDILPRAIWTPKTSKAEAPKGGVFGHLKTSAKTVAAADIPTQTMTWEKFARTVLPDAERIEAEVPESGAFFAFVTAVNPGAPPILQWDKDGTNPVSWYVYPSGSLGRMASRWSLSAGAMVDVEAITLQPSQWTGHDHHGGGVYLILRGARDRGNGGLGLFPEILRSVYHGIRAAIEAYSRSKTLPEEPAPACGICTQRGAPAGRLLSLRVTSRGGRASYMIDRMD